jgi:WD40 repeat protein
VVRVCAVGAGVLAGPRLAVRDRFRFPGGFAFSPVGGLLATANDGSVSVFSVNRRTGALRAVAVSPFSTGSGAGDRHGAPSVAFSPGGGLLATPSGGGSVAVFSTAPVISAARESAKRWREGNKLPSVNARQEGTPRVDTTFSFTLNERATVAFSFTNNAPGRNVQHRCVRPTELNRHRPGCTRTLAAGTFTFTAGRGANMLRFDGRISTTKKLKPGRYRLVITATDTADGHQSASGSLSFTIVR